MTTIEGYCWPLSVLPGETIDFKVSSTTSYKVSFLRLKRQLSGDVGVLMEPALNLEPTAQPPLPEDWIKNGCNWQTTFSFGVPADWRSGIYAAGCSASDGSEFYIVFIVKPTPMQRGEFLAVASTNTWNAYNSWGGYGKYTQFTPDGVFTHLRPNPSTTPTIRPAPGVNDHLTLADLWILNWLEDAGYHIDVITDGDLHTGFGGIAQYPAVILTTHPEYWSVEMLDHLQDYLANGGSLLYLGGNGIFERCIFSPDGTSLTFFNGGPVNNPDADRLPALMRNLKPPRPERATLGVACLFDNYWGNDSSKWFAFPYEVKMAEHPFFAGTGLVNGNLIGKTGLNGLNGGGASGWEWDTMEAGAELDDSKEVQAKVSSDRGAPPANIQLLARGINPPDATPNYHPLHGADMTYYDTGSGGFVFSAGSICFGGSLVQDAGLQTIVRNALKTAAFQPFISLRTVASEKLGLNDGFSVRDDVMSGKTSLRDRLAELLSL